jgi:beta-glucosidase
MIWPLKPDAIQRLDADGTHDRGGKSVKLPQGDIAFSIAVPDDIRTYQVWVQSRGGNLDPGGRHNATPAEWFALADAFHDASVDQRSGGNKRSRSCSALTPCMATAMWWARRCSRTTSAGCHCAMSPPDLRQIGDGHGKRNTGMDWSFAPTVTNSAGRLAGAVRTHEG